jgi:LysR family transcriptional regulator, regulator of gene expression of beta-lactamase
MQAVLDGVGVAVAQLCYVSDALAAGRLVAPFPIVAHTREFWLLEYRPVRREDPALLAFRDWLLSEAERQSRVEAELVARPARPASRKQASTQSPPQRKRQPNLMQVSRARRPPPRRG